MGSHTDSCQFAPFSNDLLVMKIVTVSDLCLTCVILSFILIYLLWLLVLLVQGQLPMTHASFILYLIEMMDH